MKRKDAHHLPLLIAGLFIVVIIYYIYERKAAAGAAATATGGLSQLGTIRSAGTSSISAASVTVTLPNGKTVLAHTIIDANGKDTGKPAM